MKDFHTPITRPTSQIIQPPHTPLETWFHKQGWKPLPFQTQAWEAYHAGKSGVVSVATGSGKTYSIFLAAALKASSKVTAPGLKILYITPLRALSRDIERALKRPIEELGWPLTVMSRTGDTGASQRQKQKTRLPEILITTPESLSILLSYPNAEIAFAGLQCTIIDEWHELLSSKRGVQTELCLSALRMLAPNMQTWGLSATIGNLSEAAQTLVGSGNPYTIIQSEESRKIHVHTLLPESTDSFPWAGHLGLVMLPELLKTLEIKTSTLLFTNTRNQAERWYQELSAALPKFFHKMALHHGSIDREERERIETGVKLGVIKWVVCTSSLDLGVDFAPVERVVQIGSAKGFARLMQRAGRSGHQPGKTSEILFVPTNALEILEVGAYRHALQEREIESRVPLKKPYDCLIQHLVTLACGDGFDESAVLNAIRKTHAYESLTDEEFRWCLEFITTGGRSLQKYTEYKKVVFDMGRWRIATPRLARLHRMSIGTILSTPSMTVKFQRGKPLGTVEESFIAKLKEGDAFFFAGKMLELVTVKDLNAIVKLASKNSSIAPSWAGGRLPISPSLSAFLRKELASPTGSLTEAERTALKPIFDAQRRYSQIPNEREVLMELCSSKEGRHLFVFPFEGRFVHEGIAALWSFRFAEVLKGTFNFAFNDYGFEILGPHDYPFQELFSAHFLATERLGEEIERSLNMAELANRQFRGIAQVAGLVFNGYPGEKRAQRQLQASSQLLFRVFNDYDSESLLLKQARQEVLEQQLEKSRLEACLERMKNSRLIFQETERPSPLAFPLMIERLGTMRGSLSNETSLEIVERLKREFSAGKRG
ncbi:MAG: ligase-associated DNA damage response DEXH box helicase [Chloroherpetonaceae bacterium]|nr:ligase-associated DNA damage response DEXH box helicase [Chloroherpetonaceae bacterium]